MKAGKRITDSSSLPPPFLTRLATLSGVSRGCRNSAVMSVSDWPDIWAETFEVPDGPGSKSLSSSSSPRLGSGREGDKMLALVRQQALPPPREPMVPAATASAASAARSSAVDEDLVADLLWPLDGETNFGELTASL